MMQGLITRQLRADSLVLSMPVPVVTARLACHFTRSGSVGALWASGRVGQLRLGESRASGHADLTPRRPHPHLRSFPPPFLSPPRRDNRHNSASVPHMGRRIRPLPSSPDFASALSAPPRSSSTPQTTATSPCRSSATIGSLPWPCLSPCLSKSRPSSRSSSPSLFKACPSLSRLPSSPAPSLSSSRSSLCLPWPQWPPLPSG
jgi:hypothetical protein